MRSLPSLKTVLRAMTVATTLLLGAAAQADVVLLGSDYFETVPGTFFGPAGALLGVPLNPGLWGTTDTIVQRQGNCTLTLSLSGSNCTIPIEVVALSLFSVANPMMMFRESPSVASVGQMTITSDGSGTGGTFSSFFDVFVELSLDGGLTFNPLTDLVLRSSGTSWTTLESGLLIDGLVGDQAANRHVNKGQCSTPLCVDFYLGSGPGSLTVLAENSDTGNEAHLAMAAHSTVPEPLSVSLVALALIALASVRRKQV